MNNSSISLQTLQQVDRILFYYFNRRITTAKSHQIKLTDLYELLPRSMDFVMVLGTLVTVAPHLYKIKGDMFLVVVMECNERQEQLQSAYQTNAYLLVVNENTPVVQSIRHCLLHSHKKQKSKQHKSVELSQMVGGTVSDRLLEQQQQTINNVLDISESEYIKSGMTLQERVRARAQYRKKGYIKSTNNLDPQNDSSLGAKKLLNTHPELLQLADAIHSFMRRHSRVGVTRSSVSLKEISRHLAGALPSSKLKRAKRKHIHSKLLSLCDTVPQWISITVKVDDGRILKYSSGDPSSSLWTSFASPYNKAVLEIKRNMDFTNQVRTKLGGKSSYKSSKNSSNHTNQILARSMPPPPSKISIPSIPGSASKASPLSPNSSSSSKIDFKLSYTPNSSTGNDMKNRTSSSPPHRVKRMRRRAAGCCSSGGEGKKMRVNEGLHFGSDDASFMICNEKEKVQQISVKNIGDTNSPRGLKRLFNIMKDGGRI